MEHIKWKTIDSRFKELNDVSEEHTAFRVEEWEKQVTNKKLAANRFISSWRALIAYLAYSSTLKMEALRSY
jgi:hypothetical protein